MPEGVLFQIGNFNSARPALIYAHSRRAAS